MTSSGFLPQITLPTRITESTMTIIDNIYCNTFTTEIHSGNILIQIADHLAQFVSINKQINTHKNTSYYKRDYKNFNEQIFLDDLAKQNWSNETYDPNIMYDDFIWRLEGVTNRHAPLKKLNKKEVKLNNKPWITANILKKIKQKFYIF